MMDRPLFNSTKLYETLCGTLLDATVRNALGELAWPTVKDDDWKYSDLTPLAKRAFETAPHMTGDLPAEAKKFFKTGAVNLVFINGVFSARYSELARLPSGLAVTCGKESVAQAQSLKPYFNGTTKNDARLLLSLNQVFANDLILLHVGKGQSPKVPVQILHVIDDTAEKKALFPKIFIHLAPFAELSVLETTICTGASEYLNIPVTEALLEDNAALNHVQAQAHSPAAFHVGSVRVWLKQNARLNSFLATNGARIFRSHVNAILEGQGAAAILNGLHALRDERHADSHTFIHHVAPNAHSNQLYKCILDGESHSVFHGKVLVEREAQLTNSYQLNKNLLLSRTCHADTKPELKINADDVKCTHGATIGQLNDEEIFYLETRGIARQDAARMLTRGFVDDVLNQITNPLLRSAVSELIPI